MVDADPHDADASREKAMTRDRATAVVQRAFQREPMEDPRR